MLDQQELVLLTVICTNFSPSRGMLLHLLMLPWDTSTTCINVHYIDHVSVEVGAVSHPVSRPSSAPISCVDMAHHGLSSAHMPFTAVMPQAW